MKHEPGCAHFRQRPCTCAYLNSWKPEPVRVIPVTRMFTAPIGTPADCFWGHAVPVANPGNITLEWTVEDVNLETFALLSGQPVHTLLDTPQNRDEARRAGLETMEEVRERIQDERSVAAHFWDQYHNARARLAQQRQQVREEAMEEERAAEKRCMEEERLRYWRDTARFYRHLALAFVAISIPLAILSTGAMLGWWW